MYSVIRDKTYLQFLLIFQQRSPRKKIKQTERTKISPSKGSSDEKLHCEVIHSDYYLRTFDFPFPNVMQSIFSWALRVHEKILIFSGDLWAFSFVFLIYMFTYETRFNEIERVSWAKLTVKVHESNNAAHLCSSFIRFRW